VTKEFVADIWRFSLNVDGFTMSISFAKGDGYTMPTCIAFTGKPPRGENAYISAIVVTAMNVPKQGIFVH